MPYVNCPNCGQKALTVASRCPQCGLPFENQFSQHQGAGARPRASRWGFLIAGAVLAVVVTEVLRREPGGAPRVAPAAIAVDSPPRSAVVAPQELPEATVDTGHGAPPPVAQPAAAHPRIESPPPAPAAAQSTPTAATAVDSSSAQPRYANLWVNVRSERNNSSTVSQILRPGQMVLVDTLIKGWYRLVANGNVVGYVDSHYLDATPPQDTVPVQ